MKRFIVFKTFLLILHFSSAQSVFDQLVQQVDYSIGDFDIKLNFEIGHYKSSQTTITYSDLSEEQLLKLVNDQKDNYKTVGEIWYSITKQRINNEIFDEKTDEYYNNTLIALEKWVNSSISDIRPLELLFDLGFTIQNGDLLGKLTKYSEKRHLNAISIVNYVLKNYLFNELNFAKFDSIFKPTILQYPDNLELLELFLTKQRLFLALNLKKEKYSYSGNDLPLEITPLKTAAKKNPKSVGHQHLMHYSKLLQLYLKDLILKALYDEKIDEGLYDPNFRPYNLSRNDLKHVSEAIRFFSHLQKNQLTNAHKRIVFNHMAFCHKLLQNYDVAKKFYRQAYELSKNIEDLQALVQIAFLQNNTDELLQLAEEMDKLTTNGLVKAKLLKLKVLTDRGETSENLKQLVDEILNHPGQILEKYESLSLWYAKNKDKANLDKIRAIFPENSPEYYIYAVLSYALDDQTESAKYLLNVGLEKYPNSRTLQRFYKVFHS